MKEDNKMVGSAILAAIALSALVACGGDGGSQAVPEKPAPEVFAIGGTLGGLVGSGLVLQNNAGDDLPLAANGNFTFARRLESGTTYNVTVKTQPVNPQQLCTVASGSGTLGSANVTQVAVTCAPVPLPAAFTIGGMVTGLKSSLILQNNGGNDLTIGADGAFLFAGTLANGAAYDISVKTQPGNPPQVCTVSNGSGTVNGADVANVAVACASFLSVVSTTPADNASGIERESSIVVEFSAELDPDTVSAANIKLSSPGAEQAIKLITSGKQVTVVPVDDLPLAARLTLTISPAVRGSRGEALVAAVSRTFRVRDGEWSAPAVIQASTQNGFAPLIGFDAKGNAIAIWGQQEGSELKLAANRYVVGTGWDTAIIAALDSRHISNAQLAVAPDGSALAVWDDLLDSTTKLINAAHFDVGTGWGADVLLGQSESLANYPQVACDPKGNAMAVWSESGGVDVTVWARPFDANLGWQTAEPLGASASAPGFTPIPQVAMDRNGNAMVVWLQKNGLFYDGWSRRFAPGSGWAAGALFESGDDASANGPKVAFDADGTAIVVFMQGTPNFGPSSIWANRNVPGTGWEKQALLEHDDLAPGSMPNLAVDASGNVLVVWQHSDLSRAQTDIWSNRYTPGTGWGNEVLIEQQRLGGANHAHVAVDPSGNGIAIWQESDNTRFNIWVNRYLAGSGWGVPRRLDLPEIAGSDPQIAIDGQGNAFAIWVRYDGAQARIVVSRFE